VRVPDHIGAGVARVALAFPSWPEGGVAPATTDLPVRPFLIVDSVQLQTTLQGHTDPVSSLACSPDATLLASATATGTIKLWDWQKGKERTTLAVQPGMVYSIAFAPNGHSLAVAVLEERRRALSGGVNIWDVETGKLQTTLRHTTNHGVSQVAFSPDGKFLAAREDSIFRAGGKVGVEVALWDLANQQVCAELKGSVNAFAFAPDGKSVITAGKTVQIWEADSATPSLTLPGSSDCLAISADGRLLAGGSTGKIMIWDLTKSELLGAAELDERPRIYSLAFAPNGKTLAVATGDNDSKIVRPGRIALVDVATLEERANLQGHRGAVHAVAFSPDGHTLFSASQDRTVRIWNLDK
jgi:WD40 repeat protein